MAVVQAEICGISGHYPMLHSGRRCIRAGGIPLDGLSGRRVGIGFNGAFPVCVASLLPRLHHAEGQKQMNPERKKEVRVSFRVVGLDTAQIHFFQARLDNIVQDIHCRKEGDSYVLWVELMEPDVCRRLEQLLEEHPLSVPYGIWVSIVTEYDSDGIILDPFICDFWRKIGGTMEFFFAVV